MKPALKKPSFKKRPKSPQQMAAKAKPAKKKRGKGPTTDFTSKPGKKRGKSPRTDFTSKPPKKPRKNPARFATKPLGKFARAIGRRFDWVYLLPIAFFGVIIVGAYLIFLTGGDDEPKPVAHTTATTPEYTTPGTSTTSTTSTTTTPGGTTTTTTTTTPPKPKPKPKPKPIVLGPALEFARKRANGDYALAQAIGSTESPGKIFLTIGTAPKQPVSVNWSITCLNGGANGGKSRSNAFQVTPPSVTEIPLTSPRPIRCTVSAQAQPTLAGSARVKVVLTAQKRT